jgi:hypothetical protein
MVDGTVPDWHLRKGDFLFDHHRPDGAKIQIEDIWKSIEKANEAGIDIIGLFPQETDDILFVTTLLDADAVCSAVYLFKGYFSQEALDQDTERKLCAISYDCDHLAVPSELSEYADFAAKCVAGMKCDSDEFTIDLDMPKDRRQWTIEDKEYFMSRAFEKSFWNLVRAVEGKDNWPCDHPKVSEYWEKVEKYTNLLIEEKRINFYKDCAVVTMSGLGGTYIDPRCAYRAIDRLLGDSDYSEIYPYTLTQREVIVDNKFVGNKYTLACNPNHPESEGIDFTKEIYSALSEAEKARDPNAEGWSGRATVGGSGWNTCSVLCPQEVIEIVLKFRYF